MPDEMALPPETSTGADEFEGIEPPRRMKSPVLAVLAALIAGYLLYHLRTDLAYWMRGRSAQELGEAHAAIGKLPPPNSYVALSGAPDRSNAAMLDTRGKDEYRQMLRLLGTDSRLLVLRTFGKIPNERTLADKFSGRLVAFRDLSFAQSIREWFRTRVVATHFFDAQQLGAILHSSEADLRDLAGDRVHLRADSRIALDMTFPDQYRVTMPTEKFPTADSARAALAKAGFDSVEPAGLPVDLPHGDDMFVLVGRPRPEVREGVIKTIQSTSDKSVVAPDPADPAELYAAIPKSVYVEGLAQAQRHLENIGFEGAAPPPLAFHAHVSAAKRDAAIEALDPLVGVQPRTETWERTFAQLGAAKDLDLGRVARAKLIEPLVIPDDAHVVVESDAPAQYWYVPVVYVLLVLFLGFNLFALREALPWRAKAASASSTR
jgi:hypothetical protein